jgi:hypothetical protein
MSEVFTEVAFADVDLNNRFFDSLKSDYEEFPAWFAKKADSGERAFMVADGDRIDAFVYLKDESDDKIELTDADDLPAEPRLKIGTLKVSDDVRGTRLGEGAIGIALWRWRERYVDQVYVTVFEKHAVLVGMLERFGFRRAGTNPRGELVMVKDRQRLDYSDGFASFPFVRPDFDEAYVLPINDVYHDRLFPYSELAGQPASSALISAGNGVSKVYLANPGGDFAISAGNPIVVYRIFTGEGPKTFKSAATSFCLVTGVRRFRRGGRNLQSIDDLLAFVRNRSVFTEDEIRDWYEHSPNLTVVEMLYLGYFGAGKNVTHRTLADAGLFPAYPYSIRYSPAQFRQVLRLGRFDGNSLIVDQPAAR